VENVQLTNDISDLDCSASSEGSTNLSIQLIKTGNLIKGEDYHFHT